MHCFNIKLLCFRFRFVCFCEWVPRFVKLELTLNKSQNWHGLIMKRAFEIFDLLVKELERRAEVLEY